MTDITIMVSEATISPIFIGACPRSGTTFLGERLGVLLGGRVTPESQFKRPVLRHLADGHPEKAVAHLDADTVYKVWSRRPSRGTLLGSATPEAFFQHLVFPEGSHYEGKSIWIDHTPINFDDFHALCEAFPKARFVNLVRDGRAVFASVRRLDWGPTNPIHGAWWWSARAAAGFAASLNNPELCHTVRYEDLVRGDLGIWTRLIQFLTADASQTITQEALEAQGDYIVPEFSKNQHALVGGGLAADRAESWRKSLTPREIEIFEANAGAMLDACGYPRDICYPTNATRGERVRYGEWPIKVSAEPIQRLRQRLRWSKVRRQARKWA